jgi:hypothetical protein
VGILPAPKTSSSAKPAGGKAKAKAKGKRFKSPPKKRMLTLPSVSQTGALPRAAIGDFVQASAAVADAQMKGTSSSSLPAAAISSPLKLSAELASLVSSPSDLREDGTSIVGKTSAVLY